MLERQRQPLSLEKYSFYRLLSSSTQRYGVMDAQKKDGLNGPPQTTQKHTYSDMTPCLWGREPKPGP
jgi:hypothetical protein